MSGGVVLTAAAIFVCECELSSEAGKPQLVLFQAQANAKAAFGSAYVQ
jgi:hypothetical protein